MEKRNLVEKKIYEEKAYRIVADLAVKTIDETALTSIVTIHKGFTSSFRKMQIQHLISRSNT